MTYKQALAKVKREKEKAGTVTTDAGNGWLCEMRWCPRRRRVVQTTLTPYGVRIV